MSTTKKIKLEVFLPVTLELMVAYADDYTEADIKAVVSACVDLPTVRGVEETLSPEEFEHLLVLGGAAPQDRKEIP